MTQISSGSGIYKICNKANGKFYVGSAVNLSKRWKNHLRELKAGTHHSRKLQSAWNKYGEDSFEFSVIREVEILEDLIPLEQFWIDTLSSVKCGYNVSPTAGSPLVVKHTPEARRRMSEAHKGHKHSPERIAEWVEKMLPHRKHTPEKTAKIAKANTGQKRSGQALENIRAGNLRTHVGRVQSPEEIERRASRLRGGKHTAASKANMSAAQKGRKNSPEACARMSATNKKRGVAPSQEARDKATVAIKAKAAARRAAKTALEPQLQLLGELCEAEGL